MDSSSLAAGEPASRRNGWNPERKLAFLHQLAVTGSVRAACVSAGMSREAAYRLRRRDALFAQGWEEATGLARKARGGKPPCCPIDGLEEVVLYRGRPVGTRRRYDTRLLLAHLARLDRQVNGLLGEAANFSPWTV